MACFGRTAQPKVGQARTNARRLAVLSGVVLWSCWTPRLEAQTRSESPAGTESASVAERSPHATSAAPDAPKSIALDEIVSVDPGATCLDRARLIDRVARWLQRTEVDVPLGVQVRGDADLATRVFFLVKTEPGDSAERRLDNAPSDCDQLHSAVALSIALAIEATLQRPPGSKGLPDVPDKPPGWQRKPAAHPMHLELALMAGASVGVLTGASFAGTPRLGFSPLEWLELSIVGLATHLSGETIAQVGGGSFESTLLAGGLDACIGGETTQGVSFFMCAGGRFGSFRGAGSGFNAGNVTSFKPWWALAGSGQARFWISSAIAVGTSVEALYALAQRDIVVRPARPEDDSPEVRRPVSSLGLSVTIGPVFRFF
jgi:hypothetical protein